MFISAEAANRASIMGAAFLKPDNLQGNHGGAGAGGRRGSDPRRTTALEQQHLANVAADKRPGKFLRHKHILHKICYILTKVRLTQIKVCKSRL